MLVGCIIRSRALRGPILIATLSASVLAGPFAPRGGRAQERTEEPAGALPFLQPAPDAVADHAGVSGIGDFAVLFVPVGGGTWKSMYGTDDSTRDNHTFSGSYVAIALVGLRLAGYGVLTPKLQLGGYLLADIGRVNSSSSEGAREVSDAAPVVLDASAGIAFKFGKVVKDKVFVGVAEDLGLALHHADLREDDIRAMFGGVSTTRLVLEPPITSVDRVGIAFSLGIQAFIVQGRALESTDALTSRWIRIQPVLLLGVFFGG
jgi:hypothetical protein